MKVAVFFLIFINFLHISEQMGTDRDPGDQKHPTTSQQPRDSKMQLAKVLLPDGVQKEFEVNVSF